MSAGRRHGDVPLARTNALLVLQGQIYDLIGRTHQQAVALPDKAVNRAHVPDMILVGVHRALGGHQLALQRGFFEEPTTGARFPRTSSMSRTSSFACWALSGEAVGGGMNGRTGSAYVCMAGTETSSFSGQRKAV